MLRFMQKSESVWTAGVELPKYRSLKNDIKADVCIVGAGIAGLSTAYLLAKAGQKVAVLDDGTICSGQTAVTTAHLASAFDDRYFSMERLHGQDGARLIAESHSRAIDKIEEIAGSENIDCEFVRLDGYLFAPPGESTEDIDKEYEAARRTGILKVDRLS